MGGQINKDAFKINKSVINCGKKTQMKRTLLLSIVLAGLFIGSPSQAQNFTDLNLKVGVGLRPTFFPSRSSGEYGPFGVSIDGYIDENISIGVLVAFSGARVRDQNDFGDFYDARYGYLTTAFRLNYDLLNEGFGKIYVGATLGFHRRVFETFSSSGFGGDPDIDRPFPLAYGLYLGADVNVSEKIGLFAEGGYGLSLIRFGLSIDLGN